MSDDNAPRSKSIETPADPESGEATNMLVSGWLVFGRYSLEELVGRGGMGVVWRAHDDLLDEPVALKFLAKVVARDGVAVYELRQETMRARRLVHAHIACINDFMRDRRFATVSMEYVDGETLGRLRLAQPGGVFSVTALAPLVGQLCLALDYAHQSANIVHGDLKPSKVLVTPEGMAKIIDFGIGRSLVEAGIRLTSQPDRSDVSIFYLSPQQLDGGRPNAADDVYAFGAILYELLTGKPPFHTGDIASQIHTAEPPLMAARRAELGTGGEPIPPAWEKTVAACLAKDPARRPSSAGEIARLLGLVGGRLAAKEETPVDAVPLATGPVVRSSSASESGQSPARGGSKPAFGKPPSRDNRVQTPPVPSEEPVHAVVPAPLAVASAPAAPPVPIPQAEPVPPETPGAVAEPVSPEEPVHAVAPAPPAVASVPAAPPVPIPQAEPVLPETPEAVAAPVSPEEPVHAVVPALPAIASVPAALPAPIPPAEPVLPETPGAVAATVSSEEPVHAVAPALPAVASVPAAPPAPIPPAEPVLPETPGAVAAPVSPEEPVHAVAPAPLAVASVPAAPPAPIPPAEPVLPETPGVVAAPVSPEEPVHAVAPAPPAVVSAPAQQPARSGPQKKRSAIHYRTAEEIDREVEEDERAAQSVAGGGRKERSWLSRAWKGFLRH
jgi:serine/threonine protein kinase